MQCKSEFCRTVVCELLSLKALHPFYIFQLFSCTLWFIDQYVWYAACIVLISVLSLTAQIYQTRSVRRHHYLIDD